MSIHVSTIDSYYAAIVCRYAGIAKSVEHVVSEKRLAGVAELFLLE
jgi:hypothetical protein